MSHRRSNPAARVARLEEKAVERERHEGTRSPLERAWERALTLAPAEEVEELEHLEVLSHAQEPESLALLETMLKVWELKERIMYREAPILAADFYRPKRDLLLIGLERLTEEAEQHYKAWFESPRPRYTPGASGEEAAAEMRAEVNRRSDRLCGLSTAAINRKRVVSEGVEPITDVAEATRLVMEVLDAVDGPDSRNRVLHLIGWGQRS
jgi:hypothetical protein